MGTQEMQVEEMGESFAVVVAITIPVVYAFARCLVSTTLGLRIVVTLILFGVVPTTAVMKFSAALSVVLCVEALSVALAYSNAMYVHVVNTFIYVNAAKNALSVNVVRIFNALKPAFAVRTVVRALAVKIANYVVVWVGFAKNVVNF